MAENNEFSFENEAYRKTYWHTCSHVLAQAVKRLHPEVKLAIGPSIDNGFYYDFDAPFAFTPEIMEELEAEMRKICKEKLKLERFELPREEAIKYMEEKNEPYKVELINDLPLDAHISFYTQGEFTDLCAGPHLDSTGRIKGNAIKLTQCCGAYWRGDSKRKMLQRIYAVAFPKKDDLDAYLGLGENENEKDLSDLLVLADAAMLNPACADAESPLHIQLLMQKQAVLRNVWQQANALLLYSDDELPSQALLDFLAAAPQKSLFLAVRKRQFNRALLNQLCFEQGFRVCRLGTPSRSYQERVFRRGGTGEGMPCSRG